MVKSHEPVLLSEIIEYLVINPSGFYIDATFGRGGHSLGILQKLKADGGLYAVDKDLAAIIAAQQIVDQRFNWRHSSFVNLKGWMQELQLIGKISGIVMDLGVSSPQLDDEQRGFSFTKDGPLDMRMDLRQSRTAAMWINSATEAEIGQVLRDYGEERFYRKIAQAIVNARQLAPINTTLQLASLVSRANPRWEAHKHPATRVFQAIRIFINQELDELTKFLPQCLDLLQIGGRLAVITFHSLEYRLVKSFIQQYCSLNVELRNLPLIDKVWQPKLKSIARAVKPSVAEIKNNPRARSAILQVAEKVA